jgi:hypothetical protein
MFAAELLMPKEDIITEYTRLLKEDNRKNPDEKIIVELQQQYYVEYKAVTKRLAELDLIDNEVENSLNIILENDIELIKLTKRLGYSDELNKPSFKVQLPKNFLKAIEENYKNNNISFDDLTVIFGYCNLEPGYFGYEEDEELSEDAKSLMEELNAQLGSDANGQE